jgi:hypothetical protein
MATGLPRWRQTFDSTLTVAAPSLTTSNCSSTNSAVK